MAKGSRTKRRRAAVRSAKRARNNNWWYGLTAFVVIVGIALIVYARMSAPSDVGPFIFDQNNPTKKDTHWHAALGVYECDHWVGDGVSGDGLWKWPSDPQGFYRAGQGQVYAGLHSHRDGIIHMEPTVSEDAGRHATVGRYFDYGGWQLSATGYKFVDGKAVRNGDACPTGGNGTLQWATARWDGKETTDAPLQFTQRTGNPGDYKLDQGDVVVIAFVPPGKSILDLNGDGKGSNPPSYKNLPSALGAEESPQTPTAPATTPAAGSKPASGSTPSGSTTATTAGK